MDKEKRRALCLLLTGIFIIGVLFASEQQRPQEEVTVTAVEVPVRVLLKGQVVRDLKRDDFEVFENGVKQEITQFEVVSRKIALPAAENPSLAAEKVRPSKRLFLLIFNIFDYNEAVGEAVDYFFRDVFRPGDQIIVLTEDQVLDIPRGEGIDELIRRIKESLRTFKSISVQSTVKNFRDLNFEADRLLGILRGTEQSQLTRMDNAIMRFFDNYQRIWEDYRRRFLEPDVAFYRNLVMRLRAVEGEKWAVCFQQREMFPRIKSASRLEIEIRNWVGAQIDPQTQVSARLVQARQQDLERSFEFEGNIDPEALSDLFLGADFTFHLILMKSSRTVIAQDFELQEVGKEYEELMTRISRSTGGYSALSNQVTAALKDAAELEDYHYLLVYSPKETSGTKKREIEVRVKRSGVDVAYLKNYLEAGPPPVAIADFKVRGKVISFAVRNCQMTKINDRRRGVASVKITIYDGASNKVFDEGKTLDVFKEETRISLNFGWLNAGTYFIVVEAADLVANRTDVYSGLVRL
jgi:hypothetical protein